MPDNNELHIATKEGDLVHVQSQVHNFDINAQGEGDKTALIIAAENGHAEVVELLLTFNPDVNIPDVSTFKVKSVHLICISPVPLSLLHFLLSTHLDTSCYHADPITLSSYFLLRLLLFDVTSSRRFVIR